MVRKIVLLAMIAFSFFVLGVVGWKLLRPSLPLQTCFQNIADLQVGAPVLVAGVQTGEVTGIRRAQGSSCPVVVEFALYLPKHFVLPRSTPVRLQVSGVLGHPYLEVDPAGVAGPPARPHDTLLAREYTAGLNPEAAAKIKKVLNEAIDGATAHPIDPASKK